MFSIKSKSVAITTSLLMILFVSLIAKAQIRKRPSNNLKDDNTVLPLDKNVRKGRLANGFTYYIRRNTEPKNRVIFYLVNKVGSILEEENQRGLAHFTEHMSFNGTKHYPKNELVDYLQKSGVRFGADLNAYTNFDETVYQLPLPTDNKALLQHGIQIMRDWAQDALLDPVEIDKERGVILEEERLGKGAQQRMQQKVLPILTNHSRYADRLPIGLDTVLNNFKPETIREFYHDWYRPNLQALIIVGDIDVNQMEQTIKAKFSDLKNLWNEKPRNIYKITLTGKNQFSVVTDKEMTNTVAQVVIKQKNKTVKTAADYRVTICVNLFNSILRERFGELVKQADPPFIQVNASINMLIADISGYSEMVVAKPGELENGFKTLWRETDRIKKYGFTQTELDRAKTNYLSNVEANYKEKAKISSESYVNEYLANFLNGSASPGLETEYKLLQNYLPKINLSEVNDLTKKYILDGNRDIIIEGPEKDKGQLPDEKTVDNWIKSVDKEYLTMYKDNAPTSHLLTNIKNPGKIIKETKLEAVNATELILNNGVKIILKPTTFKDNEIDFTSFAPGGTSLYNDADYQSAANASSLISAGGVGDFNLTQLQKYLSGKQISVSTYIADRTQGINGSTTPKDFETALQLVYLEFTRPRKDKEMFQNIMSRSKAALTNRGNDPNSVFSDTISAVIGNYNVRTTGPSLAKLEQINLDRCYEIYKERFADASGFTFTFVGNLNIKQIRPLLEKYLGTLPSTNLHEQPKDLGIYPPKGKIIKIVYKGKESKASVKLIFNGDYRYNEHNNKTLQALAEILEIRLTERLREDESGIYTPQSTANYIKYPSTKYGLTISFGCAPQNVDKLIASTLDEISKIKTNGPDEVNIEKFKAESTRGLETILKTNGFWLNYINNQYQNNDDLNVINNLKNILDTVDRESIKDAANKYLSGDNLIRFILMPEK